MDKQYGIECPICDIETVIGVPYDDDLPRHCPMCGSDADAEEIEPEEFD
jgi:endogenous inhibitor of DNA gyrase (YacG/DUF329 family)|tara:strand:+ start:2564 stop:2710 length:147 start_codon:yes stop_codon:yes gene_type:complete